MTRFAGKQTLITGAASGIGRSIALRAAQKGSALVLTDLDAHALERVVAEVRASGGRVLASRAFDVTDLDAVRAFADEVHAAHGSVDIVVNNAGIAIWGTIDRMPHEDWRRVIEVNLMGPIQILETFVPKMIEAGRGGHLVNVSSAAGLFGFPWHAAYSASKFGLRGVSEVLRFDLEKHGIRVSLVCPGGVDTPIVGSLRIAGASRDTASFQRFQARFRRIAVTADTAAARIVRGVEADRYLVYTSADIAIGHWVQEKFGWPYELAMRAANRIFESALDGEPGARR